MKRADFFYDLPDEKIARFALSDRAAAKLLVLRDEKITESTFAHIDEFIPDNSVLVRNISQVIPARIVFPYNEKRVEVLLLSPENVPIETALSETKEISWNAMIGNNRAWKEGKITVHGITIERIEHLNETFIVRFSWDTGESFSALLERLGTLPLPPYLGRAAEESDRYDYQTSYASVEGSIAAPTAGLHFTDEIFEALQKKDITVCDVVLHVGRGTFAPVVVENLEEHLMHSEVCYISPETIQILKTACETRRPIIAIGTTTTRTLESFAWYTGKNVSQFVYREEEKVPFTKTCERYASGVWFTTSIMITPEYKWRVIDALVTNFHQPHSTLLSLVSGLISDTWKTVYSYALAHDFRFLSFGDGSLLWRSAPKIEN